MQDQVSRIKPIKKALWKRVLNRILHLLCRFLPGAMTLRPFLHRLRGVKIHGRVFIGDDVYLENEYPECVEIKEGAQITIRSTIVAHTRGPGKIIIEKNVFIASNCVIVGSHDRTLTIGECSVLAAGSVVTTSIPPYTLYGGERAVPIAKVTEPLTMDTSYEDFIGGLVPFERKKARKDP